MWVGDLPDEPQTESGPAHAGRVSRLERLHTVVLGDTGAGIGHVGPVGQVADSDGNLRTIVFDRVPVEILQELPQLRRVGLNDPCRVDLDRRRPCLDSSPAFLGNLPEFNPFDLGHRLGLPCQREQVVYERLPPVDGVGCPGERVALAGLLCQFDVALGDGQRIPQVVADDTDELLEMFNLCL